MDAPISLTGGKYKPLIPWDLTDRALRFPQLHKEVPRATLKMLTRQPRELKTDGLVARLAVPPRAEYSLPELGRSIRPILEAMCAWGAEYLRAKGLRQLFHGPPWPRVTRRPG